MNYELPDKGFIFWPIGTGDSTTIRIDEAIYMQVDLRHMEKSENSDDPTWPVIDELIKILPRHNNSPYLSTFALTHPDKDHCQGFGELISKVVIGEIWMSPRTFREYKNDDGLCEDAQEFHDEAMRRVKETIKVGGDPGSGNRVRIIGYDHLLETDEFKGFPRNFLTIPGNEITMLDSKELSGKFRAFIHAPFIDDSYGDRNDCSLAFQISLTNGSAIGQALFMGDLTYPIVSRIFRLSDQEDLYWNVLLAPHHCSKSVMYWKDEGAKHETLRQHIMNEMRDAALSPGYIIASSMPIPTSNKSGDNPPHAKAKVQYRAIVPDEFICTHEHPNTEEPLPVIFEVSKQGFRYTGSSSTVESLENSLKVVGTDASIPKDAIGFGHSDVK